MVVVFSYCMLEKGSPERLPGEVTDGTCFLSCVGRPYRYHGRPVVEACVAARTDYVDICGEPLFLEDIELM